MGNFDNKLLNIIKEHGLSSFLLTGNYGIEKENLRVDNNGKLSLEKHPKLFGKKWENPYIKNDFSESQIEVITPPMDTVENAYDFLKNLTNIVNTNIDSESLWVQSLPSDLPSDEIIPIADFGSSEKGQEEIEYREFLAEKYGKKIQMISGIHYNFSFKDEFIERLYEIDNSKKTYREYKDDIYIKITRNILKLRWLIIYLTGASPAVHETYEEKYTSYMEKKKDYYYFDDSLSLRNGFCGYKNEQEFILDYTSVDKYISSIEELVNRGELTDPREFYSGVRMKGKNNKDLINSIKENGVDYIELRSIDLNPFDINGIDIESLRIVQLLILYSLLKEDSDFDIEEQEIAYLNHKAIANNGLGNRVDLFINNEDTLPIEELGQDIMIDLKKLVECFLIGDTKKLYLDAIEKSIQKIVIRENTLAYRVKDGIDKKGFVNFHLEIGKKYIEESKSREYSLIGYEDLELSTQIVLRDSIRRGLKYEVVDNKDNFIKVWNKEKEEYIKQATKTSLDSYITVMMMENKVVTKKVLEEKKIRVPKGKDYSDPMEAKKDFNIFKDRGVVIKPKSTNFGIGITIFKENYSQNSFDKAIDFAFSKDDSIIIEEFIRGKEYRFFVLGYKTIGILNRVPANVTGDGKSSIRELVVEKNKDPLRGVGYKTPLEKIKLEESEKVFLETQGYDFDTVPQISEVIYLRENSNISTGGDSIDYTDNIMDEYKEIAVKAAKGVNAKICGVDIMIDNINERPNENNYAIIELNFNPAVHIHCYPFNGKNRDLGNKILDNLGF